MNQVLNLNMSWRDKVLEIGLGCLGEESSMVVLEDKEDLDFLKGDIMKFIVDEIPLINFLDCIEQILVKKMELTLVIKQLGRNIGYVVLYNKISILWKPSKPFHLMDIKNG
ncbi:hypothetical protein PVK06_028705 [Gossypium arboreum]|uniref:Uncharacterized protein n=1 Tax=Gossypium arboreum TaxID=29729 RepID=A0ABR0P4K9_GOSAR|nr:hypothetical protein PVK06_028705 [Gossypium arboreum]